MPRNVRYFALLWLASALIAAVGIFAMPQPDQLALKLGVTEPFLTMLTEGAFFIIFAMLLPFFWLAVWRRKNWARWILFSLFFLSLPLSFLDPLALRPNHLPLTMLTFVSTFVEASAFFLIFTGDARAWFKR